jgi:hypothetical protein
MFWREMKKRLAVNFATAEAPEAVKRQFLRSTCFCISHLLIENQMKVCQRSESSFYNIRSPPGVQLGHVGTLLCEVDP